MSQEEKLNFTSTLGAMFPYKLWCRFKNQLDGEYADGILTAINGDLCFFKNPNNPNTLYMNTVENGNITPYLRDIEDMDAFEKETYSELLEDREKPYKLYEWLNKNKYDYKNWITYGMALPMSVLNEN